MLKVTPPGPAGALKETVKVKEVVPALPSLRETSLMVRVMPPHGAKPGAPVAVLRGLGVPAVKSLALLSVSVQPAEPRIAAVVALMVGVGPVPSKKFVPVPYPTRSMICASCAAEQAVLDPLQAS